MSRDIVTFVFDDTTIRVFPDDQGSCWWVGNDVARALGYKDPKSAVRRHCKGPRQFRTITDRFGRTQKVKIISEPDMYRLIVGSDLDSAAQFEKLVFEEILPSIRKHGAYLTEDMAARLVDNPDLIIQLAQELKAQRAKVKELEALHHRNADKVSFANAITASEDTMLVREFAKILYHNGIHIGGNQLMAWMREHGFLVSDMSSDHNMPTQRSINLNLFVIGETISNGKTTSIVSRAPRLTSHGQYYFLTRFLNGTFLC